MHAVSYLRDTAFTWVQPHLEKDPLPTWLTNVDLFAEKLSEAFGEADYLDNVGIDLLNLRQTGSVVAYIAEFRRLSSLLSTWHEDTFSLMFYHGLKDAIKIEVFKAKRPTKMEELTRLAMFFEKRLQTHDYHAFTAKSLRTTSKRTNNASVTVASVTGVVDSDSSPTSSLERPYCTYHRSFSHATADCRALRKHATTGNGSGLSHTPTITESDSQTRRPHIHAGATTSVASAQAEFVTDKRISVPARLMVGNKKISVSVLLDTGSSSSLIDINFVQQHSIPIQPKKQPTSLEGIDGLVVTSGTITHETEPIKMVINDHTEKIQFDVAALGHYSIVLGIPWFLSHSPTIRWDRRSIVFDSYQCQHCCEQPRRPLSTSDTSVLTQIETLPRVLDRSPLSPEPAKPRGVHASHAVRAGAATTRPLPRPISTVQHLDRSLRCSDPIHMLPGEHAQPLHVLHTATAVHMRDTHAHTHDPGQLQLASYGHPMAIARAQPRFYGQNHHFYPPVFYGWANTFGQTSYDGYWRAPQPGVDGYFPIPVLQSMSNAEGGNVVCLGHTP